MSMSEDEQEVTPPVLERYIRPAQLEDSARISAILAEAFPALYTWTFGHLSTAQTATLLCALYNAGTLDFATTRLAVQNGHIVGVAVLHLDGSIGRGTLRAYWRVVRSQLGVWKAARAFVGGAFANLAISKRIPKGDDLTYVEALAVDTSSRGQGIGAQLLQDAAEWSLARGRTRMALHVLQRNAGARRLYERTGFRLAQSEPRAVPAGSRRLEWVSLLMERDLKPPAAP
jgi:GNAT superfamily N-acetyltransferase